MSLTVGSLFAGIGGLDLGLERAGMRVVWQVEKDEYCRRVLAKHWPDVDRYEDVRDVGADDLEPVDLIAGGFPCQDIASANRKGEGISGARSGLWSEFARIVSELRPACVLIENVESLRWRRRGLGVVLRDLAALGYDAEWEVLPAAAVGAPHKRSRLFIVAHPDDQPGLQAGAVFGPVRTQGHARDDVSRSYWGRTPAPDWSVPAAVSTRVADGVPHRVDRLRALGNAVVPQVAEWIGRRIVEAHEQATTEAA